MELTIEEAAERLGLKPKSIYAIVRKGWLSARRIGKRVIVIDETSLKYAIRRPQSGRPTPDAGPAHGPFYDQNKKI